MTLRPLLAALCALAVSLPALAQSLEPAAPAGLRMNDVQAVGTHNSYKIAMPRAELDWLAGRSREAANILDYSHMPLAAQLDLGMRQLEIDVLYDPQGGLFTRPALARLVGEPFDATGLDAPGYKVFHAPDVDVRSHCKTFVACLTQIRDWSDAHPRHVPILIMMNAKDGGPYLPGGVKALDYDAAAFDALDAEIRSVFGPGRLLTPDDVRGGHATLREGALAGGWPELEAARGKVFFALDEPPAKVAVYMRGKASLEGLPVFVNSVSETEPHAAYFTLNDPQGQFKRIQDAVKAGFMVRTRADADTREARVNDVSRREKAFASGAQYVSTDYPTPRAEWGDYVVRLPEGVAARRSPVRGQASGQQGRPN